MCVLFTKIPCLYPPPSNNGKWKVYKISLTKHVLILVVTVTGWWVDPTYAHIWTLGLVVVGSCIFVPGIHGIHLFIRFTRWVSRVFQGEMSLNSLNVEIKRWRLWPFIDLRFYCVMSLNIWMKLLRCFLSQKTSCILYVYIAYLYIYI